MKKVFIMGAVLIFCVTVAWADPVDQELPKTATQQVKNSTRQMIKQGFNPENVIDMTRQMLANNFGQQHVLQAHAILMNAHKQGLPTEPIMSKAHEGLAKQAHAKAVVQAMEQVQSRNAFATKQAKVITNDSAKVNQMAAILAGSMAAGITHQDIGRMMQALQARTRNMTRTYAEDLAMQTFMTTQMMAQICNILGLEVMGSSSWGDVDDDASSYSQNNLSCKFSVNVARWTQFLLVIKVNF